MAIPSHLDLTQQVTKKITVHRWKQRAQELCCGYYGEFTTSCNEAETGNPFKAIGGAAIMPRTLALDQNKSS